MKTPQEPPKRKNLVERAKALAGELFGSSEADRAGERRIREEREEGAIQRRRVSMKVRKKDTERADSIRRSRAGAN